MKGLFFVGNGYIFIWKEDKEDKIKGMFYTLALGDALGVPYEFCRKKDIPFDGSMKETKMDTQFIHATFPCGAISDDTEMTIALLKSMITGKKLKYDKDKAAQEYMNWANSKGKMIGVNTRLLFRGVKTLKGYKNRAAKLFKEKVSQSNGCLMRCSPLALIEDEKERKKAVLEDVDLTNPDPICREIVSLHVEMLHQALKGKSREEIIKWLEGQKVSETVSSVLKQAKAKEKRDVRGKSKGWIMHAFYCTIYILYHYRSFTEAMNFIILLGGDTDTNSSIAGSLIGALIGYNALEKEQKKNIEVMKKARYDRPEEYYVDNIDKLLSTIL